MTDLELDREIRKAQLRQRAIWTAKVFGRLTQVIVSLAVLFALILLAASLR